MIHKIKERLKEDSDKLIELLEKIECHNIRVIHDKIRFGFDSDGSGSANTLDINTLSYKSFSRNSQGDVIVLVSDKLGISIGDSIKYLVKWLGLSYEYKEPVNVVKPFGNFWEGLSKVREVSETPPITYAMNRYSYDIGGNLDWVKDHISIETQLKYNIGYCWWTDRYVIPHYSPEGELIGVVGRMVNYDKSNPYHCKYLALLPFAKEKSLFGIHQNYRSILEANVMYVLESEKAVLQMDSYGIELGVAIGRKTILPYQARLIKSAGVDNVLCLDEGVSEEEIINECRKIKVNNPFFYNRVGYIYDGENKYLPKGSKCSPTDLGLNVFLKLLEGVRWI